MTIWRNITEAKYCHSISILVGWNYENNAIGYFSRGLQFYFSSRELEKWPRWEKDETRIQTNFNT